MQSQFRFLDTHLHPPGIYADERTAERDLLRTSHLEIGSNPVFLFL